jgi:hypothetical protein
VAAVGRQVDSGPVVEESPPVLRQLAALITTVACSALLSAGCGGSTAAHYSVAGTSLCLRQQTLEVSRNPDDLDYVAQDAGEGALHANFTKTTGSVKQTSDGRYVETLTKKTLNSVTVVLDRSDNDATRTKQAYEVFAAGAPTKDVLFERGNAVLYWDKTPTSSERSTVENCLR